MPSDEERRKVAARLRREGEMWRAYFGSYTILDMPDHIFTDSVLEAFGPDDMKTKVYKILEKMADLVDRPTCEYVPIGDGRFGCSWCGYVVRLDYDVPVADETSMPFNYCPNCGAEVVSSDAAR